MLQSYGIVRNIAVWKQQYGTETMLTHSWKWNESQNETMLSVILKYLYDLRCDKTSLKTRIWQISAMTQFSLACLINLLAPELFFLIYKLWIIQEPNTLELWNKLHFEEKKTESIYHV